MIRIDTQGLDRLERTLAAMAEQHPKTVRNAINDTAFKVMAAEREEIGRAFNQPKPWIAKNVRVFKVSVESLTASVGATDYFERGGFQTGESAWERILAPHVHGGARLQKASERRLSRAGLLPPGWFTVPGQGGRLDRLAIAPTQPPNERWLHLPADLPSTWYEQMTSERRDPETGRWDKVRANVRNEALDAAVYAWAIAHLSGSPRIANSRIIKLQSMTAKHWENMAEELCPAQRDLFDAKPASRKPAAIAAERASRFGIN